MTKRERKALADIIAFTQNQYLKGRIPADEILPSLAAYIAQDIRLEHPRFDTEAFVRECCV